MNWCHIKGSMRLSFNGEKIQIFIENVSVLKSFDLISLNWFDLCIIWQWQSVFSNALTFADYDVNGGKDVDPINHSNLRQFFSKNSQKSKFISIYIIMLGALYSLGAMTKPWINWTGFIINAEFVITISDRA